jgi:hypothetical protein
MPHSVFSTKEEVTLSTSASMWKENGLPNDVAQKEIDGRK